MQRQLPPGLTQVLLQVRVQLHLLHEVLPSMCPTMIVELLEKKCPQKQLLNLVQKYQHMTRSLSSRHEHHLLPWRQRSWQMPHLQETPHTRLHFRFQQQPPSQCHQQLRAQLLRSELLKLHRQATYLLPLGFLQCDAQSSSQFLQ
jgi:hypothetical protein